MSEYIENLTKAIAAMHECRCEHFGTEHVREEHKGELIWESNVEIFQLEGHPDAKLAYGWGWEAVSGEIEYIGILGVGPIESAAHAVRAAFAGKVFK